MQIGSLKRQKKTDKLSVRLTRENELKLLNQEQEVTLFLTFQK